MLGVLRRGERDVAGNVPDGLYGTFRGALMFGANKAVFGKAHHEHCRYNTMVKDGSACR